jgi:serine/threonine-protein kinase RsbW
MTDGQHPAAEQERRADEALLASIVVPAGHRFVGPIRALAAASGAQCGLTVDEIEDVQMGVDEACSLLLPHAGGPNPWLRAQFQLADQELSAEVSVPTPAGEEPQLDRQGLSWTVLSALADAVETVAQGQTMTIRLIRRRRASER